MAWDEDFEFEKATMARVAAMVLLWDGNKIDHVRQQMALIEIFVII